MSSNAPSVPAARPRRRWVLPVLGCLGATVGVVAAAALALAVAAWLYLPTFLAERVRSAAHQRGFAIEFASLTWSWSEVQLHGVRVRLLGVPGLEANLDRAVLRLEALVPVSAAVHGARVRATGSAPELALALAEWTRDHPETYRVPFVADGVDVEWRDSASAAPWAVLGHGALVPTPSGGTFSADQVRVTGIELGRVTAGYATDSARVELAFGAESPAAAPVVIVVEPAFTPPRATVTVRPLPLERLAAPLGVPLPVSGVTAKGEVVLELPGGFAPGPVNGVLHLELDGYVPPHPVELSGFVFGRTTVVDTNFVVTADRQRIDLTETRVTAGRFTVKGGGAVVRAGASATIELALRGDLSCAALADAAAQSRLGEALGRLAGGIARQMVEGSVAVILKIEADTRDLSQAKVLRTIGVGCGLKPLVIPGLGTVDLSTIDLSGLDLADLTSLPAGLPSAWPPGLTPTLPPVPSSFKLPPFPTYPPSPPRGEAPRGASSSEKPP